MDEANFNTDVVIGLEVHISLKTKSKLFCSCKNPSFHGKDIEPNTNVCPICLGHPGSKPVPNKKAVLDIIKFANAINCKIPDVLHFDRKNYFYPDLVKNYQITQDNQVIGNSGKLQIAVDKWIELDHIHLEEDPGSMVIENGTALIDYNRSGTPLIELVTKPNMKEASEAREFLKKLIITLEYLDIFDRYNCTLKADANVSIKESGYTRVEIKNINGFKDIQEAIEYEINRQKALVKNGETIKMETRGWDGSKTNFQRSKEAAADYGYYPENDIPPIIISNELISEATAGFEKENMYYSKVSRCHEKYAIDVLDLEIILEDRHLAFFFEKYLQNNVAGGHKFEGQAVANYFRHKIIAILNKMEISFSKLKVNTTNLSHLIQLYLNKKVDNKINGQLLEMVICDSEFELKKYIEENDLEQSNDDGFIEELANEAINENPAAVDSYKEGDLKSVNFLVGQVMKKSKGKANPGSAKEILEKILENK